MARSPFVANAYITDYRVSEGEAIACRASDREELEYRAARAATEVLTAVNVSFDDALCAMAARTNGDGFNAQHAAAFDAALEAASAAVADALAGGGGFVSLGWC